MMQFEGISSIKFPNKISAPRFHSSVIPSQAWCRKNIKKLRICPRANFLVVGLEVWNWRWGERWGGRRHTAPGLKKYIFLFPFFLCVFVLCQYSNSGTFSFLAPTYIHWMALFQHGLVCRQCKKRNTKNKNRRRHLHNERTVRIG